LLSGFLVHFFGYFNGFLVMALICLAFMIAYAFVTDIFYLFETKIVEKEHLNGIVLSDMSELKSDDIIGSFD
jgi:hypothetical protein